MRTLGISGALPANVLNPEKVLLAKYHIDWQLLSNCLGLCIFLPYSLEQVRDIVQGITGWNSSVFELMIVGQRAMAMARAFNYRQGFNASDDVVPWRFSTPFEAGPTEGVSVPAKDIAQSRALYYDMRGWDQETGAPSASKLHELGIGWVAELLES
jgi:aldehyde:ferredoxin oxidoreductase